MYLNRYKTNRMIDETNDVRPSFLRDVAKNEAHGPSVYMEALPYKKAMLETYGNILAYLNQHKVYRVRVNLKYRSGLTT